MINKNCGQVIFKGYLMNSKVIARGSATRTANMNKRRDYILSCAGRIIANEGLEALTLPRLAEDAQVTIPTIHNLLGKKADIFEKLVKELIIKTEQALSQSEISEPIQAAEAFINKLIELFSSNEDLYKAAFIAGEQTKLFDHHLPNGIFTQALQISIDVCQYAKDKGYLEGLINTEALAEELFGCQRLARHDWVHGYIDLTTYKKQVLRGMYIVFLADATPTYKPQLLKKLG